MEAIILLNALGLILYAFVFVLVIVRWKKFQNKYFIFTFFIVCLNPILEMCQEIPYLKYGRPLIALFTGHSVSKLDWRLFKKYENQARRMAHLYLELDRAFAVHYYQSYSKLQAPKFIFVQLAFIYVGAFILILPGKLLPSFHYEEVVNVTGTNQTTTEQHPSDQFFWYITTLSFISITMLVVIYGKIVITMRRQQTAGQNISQAERNTVKQSALISLFQIHFSIYNILKFICGIKGSTFKAYGRYAEWMEWICPPIAFFGFSTTLRNSVLPAKWQNKVANMPGTVGPLSVRKCSQSTLHTVNCSKGRH